MRLLLAIATATVLTSVAATPASTSPAAPAPGLASTTSHYVSMGDSYTAGATILPVDLRYPLCHPSLVNYPHLLAEHISTVPDSALSSFDDMSCAGNTTADLAGGLTPQYRALRPDTDLVTLGIGGNDIGLLGYAVACLVHLCPDDPGTGGPAPEATPAPEDMADRYAGIVRDVRDRSPHARVVLVGYPTTIRAGGCPGVQPVGSAAADRIRDRVTRLNDAMRSAAEHTGAEFADLEGPSHGHDACAPPETRWVEGVVPTGGSAPLHPTRLGHAAFAEQIAALLE
ncbi:SGNH/GDSL hydrolase family protein [Rhodococcus sp. HNM0569]|uniref:SGNH/GDSL hydrolase family protein n=1 Tax=Rhodococcus sp. HNM0569 TaxID=2716340 RepID=UPI00146C352E|nr:SGNH/GDSL hydrolase family protein [Rhodococcus sp. HNM0569]NLU82072.1 SGNH/GDSL hydrolase family protein [Rhodococcus sp. HNM0569]